MLCFYRRIMTNTHFERNQMETENPMFAEVSDITSGASLSKNRSSLRFSERKLILATIDIILLNITLAITIGIDSRLHIALLSFTDRWIWFATLASIWLVCASS